jgi:hypothetical protein
MANFSVDPWLIHAIRGPIKHQKYTVVQENRARNRIRHVVLVEAHDIQGGHAKEWRTVVNEGGIIKVLPKIPPRKRQAPHDGIFGDPDIPPEERRPGDIWIPGSDPANPHHISPLTYKGECKAWKAADLQYQQISREFKSLWRAYITEPSTSTYDWYMRCAIPHLLRSWRAPAIPIPGLRWKLHSLDLDLKWFEDQILAPHECPPPPECRTWGLDWFTAKCRRMVPGFCPDPTKPYWTFFEYRANTGHPISPEMCKFRLHLYDHGPLYAELYNSGWLRSVYPNPRSIYTAARPTYAGMTYAPIRRRIDGTIIGSTLHDVRKQITVKYIDSRHPFKHWPSPYPSTKNDPRPPTALYTNWLNVSGPYSIEEVF